MISEIRNLTRTSRNMGLASSRSCCQRPGPATTQLRRMGLARELCHRSGVTEKSRNPIDSGRSLHTAAAVPTVMLHRVPPSPCLPPILMGDDPSISLYLLTEEVVTTGKAPNNDESREGVEGGSTGGPTAEAQPVQQWRAGRRKRPQLTLRTLCSLKEADRPSKATAERSIAQQQARYGWGWITPPYAKVVSSGTLRDTSLKLPPFSDACLFAALGQDPFANRQKRSSRRTHVRRSRRIKQLAAPRRAKLPHRRLTHFKKEVRSDKGRQNATQVEAGKRADCKSQLGRCRLLSPDPLRCPERILDDAHWWRRQRYPPAPS
ncbi:hypothetical protein DFJ73DRAFT_961373 [Zopfochytrium polystomum]|nr:hypothetical protein DFJ73DRAFT_961373 [Zopfochytrium polystomum]